MEDKMRRKMLGILAIVLLLLAVRSSVAEDITLTTYYPAPSGEYNIQHVNKLGVGSRDDPDVLGLVDGQAVIATQGGYHGNPLLEVGSASYDYTAIQASTSGSSGVAIRAAATGDRLGVGIEATGCRFGIKGIVPDCTTHVSGGAGVYGEGPDAIRGMGVYGKGHVGVYAKTIRGGTALIAKASGVSVLTAGNWAIEAEGGITGTCRLDAEGIAPTVLKIDGSGTADDGIEISGVKTDRIRIGGLSSSADGIAMMDGSFHTGLYVRNGVIGVHIINDDPTHTALKVEGETLLCGDLHVTGTVTADGSDLAEYFTTEPCEAGDVMVIDRNADKRLIKSTQPYDYRVVGVVSSNPGFALGEDEENKKLVALLGQVECKVTTENGAISPGDLLVTSSKPGYLMRGDINKIKPGMIIAKALEKLEEGEGKILVLVDGR